jgi:hypothetical protein
LFIRKGREERFPRGLFLFHEIGKNLSLTPQESAPIAEYRSVAAIESTHESELP